jgi:hypothetical protein
MTMMIKPPKTKKITPKGLAETEKGKAALMKAKQRRGNDERGASNLTEIEKR